ncbi:MAG TPA: acetate--CoA ligase family protein [Candidatus Binatia bacterium]|nr:acetate--CoA ligase family protein [Candidatus Binatia bacterium]
MDLKSLFHPRSVALIGASTEQNKLSGRPLRFFREFGYAGKIYPVNPKYPEIAGVPCFATLSDIPGEVDLAVITLPAPAVPEALAECGAKGVKAAAIISSGFAEVGGEGVRLQDALQKIASRYGIAVCGPNCSGFVYFPERVTATFSVGIDGGFPEAGPAAFISQSGALSSYILGAAKERGLAFRYWITTGNECVLSFTDYLQYVLEDPEVRLVLGYLEDARDGEAFQAAARRALFLDKPLIIMKTGRSEAGAKASVSHTGSLAGADEVYQAVFAKNGVLRAETLDELFDLALLAQAPRRPRRKRVQVVSISGAAGILMADVGNEFGLEFADLSDATKDELQKIMPPFAAIANPMDVTAEAVARPGLLSQAAEVILKDPNVDNLVMFFGIVPGAHEKLATAMAQVSHGTDKLVMMTWFPLPRTDIWTGLARAGVPVFPEPARGIRALGKMAEYVATRERVLSLPTASSTHRTDLGPEIDKILDRAKNGGRNTLSEIEAKSLLKAWGLRVPRGGLARSVAEARSLANDIGRPVALKACSSDLLHKTEAGVIRLGLKNPEEVETAFEEILGAVKKWNPAARVDGVLVEEMIGGEIREVIVGARQDLRFGPMVTFGLGGIFVEAIKDFAVWPAPLTTEEARRMIRSIRGYPILAEFRGRPPADLEAVARVLCEIGRLACQWQERLAELEINPLFVLPEGFGVIVGDALVALR